MLASLTFSHALTGSLPVSRDAALALASALAAGTAALAVKNWEDAGWMAVGGALLYGLAPIFISVAQAGLELVFVAVVPIVFLALNELLVRQRLPWWLIGFGGGAVAAAPLLQTGDMLGGAAISTTMALIVIALFRPRSLETSRGYTLRALLTAGGAYVATVAFPLSVSLGNRSLTLATQNNQSAISQIAGGFLQWGQTQLQSNNIMLWLVMGGAVAFFIQSLRRVRLF